MLKKSSSFDKSYVLSVIGNEVHHHFVSGLMIVILFTKNFSRNNHIHNILKSEMNSLMRLFTHQGQRQMQQCRKSQQQCKDMTTMEQHSEN